MDSNQNSVVVKSSPVDLLNSSIEIFKKHWKQLVPVVLVPTIIMQASGILYLVSAYYSNIIVLLVSLIISVVGIILYVAMQPTFIQLLYKHKTGTHSGIHDFILEYRHGFVFFWSVIWLGILQTIIFMGASVFLIIPGIIVSVYVGFSVYAMVVEGKKGIHAIIHSYTLVKDHWFAIFGRTLFITAASFILGFVCGFVGTMILLILHLDSNPIVARIFKELINLFYTSTGGVISMIYFYELFSAYRHNHSRNINTKPFVGWLYFFITVAVIFAIAGFVLLLTLL